MTDAEISRRLALAIGWNESDILQRRGDLISVVTDSGWARYFDYRDPAVIWPIAERLACFPVLDMYNRWTAGKYPYTFADTAAKAVSLAVIKAHEGAKE